MRVEIKSKRQSGKFKKVGIKKQTPENPEVKE